MDTLDYDTYVRGLAALVAVLGLIAGAAWIARRMGFGATRTGMRRDRRLSISEVLAVDNRRRLVLIKRDAVEHLLLIGGTGDVIVERGIHPALPSGLPKVFEELK
ncbi:MAG TPA: flagellar biosynthetic protein FliO [Magnetospirillaceae bacterium]|jgi:flagellar protein FliO/FliZ